MITSEQAATFARSMSVGGIAVFPADTVYGLACDPDSAQAVRRLYALKGRRLDKPAAVLFFDLELALDALPEMGERTRSLLEVLLPGAVTALLPNPLRRWPLACGPDPHTLGLRVPALTDATAPLRDVRWPILQSSANLAGDEEPATLEDVPGELRDGADVLLDGGALPGTPSTVVDLRGFESRRQLAVVREGAVPSRAVLDAAARSG